eukprot:2126738-Pleurochrysis_carterae.AAC.2
MNTVNSYQARSQSANVDFKPLLDHCMVIEYSTKYATKFKKVSGLFENMIASVLSKFDDMSKGAKSVFASFLVQQVSGRNWSSQEVAH